MTAQAAQPERTPWGLVILLGALTAMGPVAIDMYLPSLPAIGRGLHASAGEAQATVSAFLAGMAVGQFFYGPASDRLGRRPPILVGTVIYIAASIACALAVSPALLIGGRFVQALGACAGGVVARAVVRDRFGHTETARMLSLLMLIMGLAPILAPLLGGALLSFGGWRLNFWFMTAFGVAVGLAALFRLKESRSEETTAHAASESPLQAYLALMREPRLVGYALAGALNGATLFTYIASSPELMIKTYGITPQAFGWFFGVNAVGIIGGNQVNRFLLRRRTPDQVLAKSSLVAAGFAALLMLAAFTGVGVIPLRLQKITGLPRSSSKREYLFASDLTARLCQAAPVVMFSQASLVADEHCEASPLLVDFPLISIDALDFKMPISYLRSQFEVQKLSPPSPHDFAESAPRLGVDEKLSLGAHTLKLQTLCPFRAFAETRLRAKSLDTIVLGLRANERGEIVHQILCEFWKEIKDKASLDSLSQDALNTCLQDKIAEALSRFQQKYHLRIKDTYLQLEKKRLHVLLLNLLALEKTRETFEVIELEKAHEISIGPLQFNIRIDRIDKVSNGEEVLIDYKTGKTSFSDWFADTMQEPQLPLYAVTREQAPLGLVFAVIRAEGVKFQGVLNTDECTIPGTKCFSMLKFDEARHWAQQQLAWRENVERKAFAFYEGHANVEPLQGESTCRLCDLKPLCRVG